MSYLTLAIPNDPALVSIARRIAMAFEPDSGIDPATYDAFSQIALDVSGAEFAVYGAPVEDWVSDSAPMWVLSPDQLHAAVKNYMAARFPDEPCPLLTTVKKFTNAVRVSTSYGTAAGMAEMGLIAKEQPQ